MIKVNFMTVGRDRKSWTASCPTSLSFKWLQKQVNLLAPDLVGDLGFKTVHGKGTIYEGARVSGFYEIVTETITNEGSGDNA